jgi:hypothetical protein
MDETGEKGEKEGKYCNTNYTLYDRKTLEDMSCPFLQELLYPLRVPLSRSVKPRRVPQRQFCKTASVPLKMKFSY